MWHALWRWLLDTRPARQAFEVLLRAFSRRRLSRLDQQDAVRRQTCLLLGLLHQARRTRFGREHDFARLRTPEDFRRLVPLTTPDDLAGRWWLPTWPDLAGSTWPDLRPTAADRREPLSVRSSALASVRRAALRTALAFLLDTRPQARLYSGRLLSLDDGTPFDRSCIPPLLRPYTRQQAPADGPVTCLTGSAERIRTLAEQVTSEAGVERLADAWPSLAAVFWDGPPDAEDELRRLVGSAPLLLRTVYVLDLPVAVTDPRHGSPRLLTNRAAYFEFLPLDQPPAQPTRLGLDGVRPGCRYELALTTPTGFWACRTGQVVEIITAEPPLVRFLGPLPASVVPSSSPAATAPEVLPVPHRNGGLPPIPPGTLGQIPWSVPVERG
jgi:hypothetical protein